MFKQKLDMGAMLQVLKQQLHMIQWLKNLWLILQQEVQPNSGLEVLEKQQLIVFFMLDLFLKELTMVYLLSLFKSVTLKLTLHFQV